MIFGERGGMIFEYPCIINILYLRRNVSSWIPRLGYSLRCCLPCRCRGNPRRSSRALPPPRSSSPPSSSSASTTLEAPGHCRYQFLINKIWIIDLIRGPVAEFKEFERRFKFKPRFKYGWFHLKLYQMFQDLSRRFI